MLDTGGPYWHAGIRMYSQANKIWHKRGVTLFNVNEKNRITVSMIIIGTFSKIFHLYLQNIVATGF